MKPHSRLLPLILGALCLASVATAQQSERPSAAERRRAAIERRLEEIYREKIRGDVPSGPERPAAESKATGDGLMRAPGEVAVTETSEQEAEIHAVINPADSNNIVLSAIRSLPSRMGLTLPIYYSRDFGETWQLSSFQPTAMAGGDPVLTADADGVIYFSWIELIPRSQSRIEEGILWSRSTDGGATWARADTIAWGVMSSTGNGTSGEFADKQWMAVDRSSSEHRGTVYTVYFNLVMGSQPDLAIVVQRKPAGAATFLREKVRVTDASVADMQFASIGVDHLGAVHVFYFGQRMGDTDYRLWHAVSRDGARSFEGSRPVGPIRFPERSNNVPDHLPQRLGALPQFAVDGDATSPHRGNLYAVWFSNDLTISGPASHWQNFHVYFARSTDGGASWSQPRRVNDDIGVSADHLYPSIDVAPNGAVVITWYDGRARAGNSELHHYTAYSLDGGATLGENIRVSTESSSGDANVIGNFGIGDYTKCLSTNGYAIPIWVDGRTNDGDLNVFAAFVPLRNGPSGVEERREVVEAVRVSIAPNPAAERSMVELRLAAATEGRVEILDLRGEVVATLASGRIDAGTHRFDVDCSALPSGRYVVRVADARGETTSMLDVVR